MIGWVGEGFPERVAFEVRPELQEAVRHTKVWMVFSRGGQQQVDKVIGWFWKAWHTKKSERGNGMS